MFGLKVVVGAHITIWTVFGHLVTKHTCLESFPEVRLTREYKSNKQSTILLFMASNYAI